MNKIAFREWEREKEKLKDEKKPSLLLAMVRAFGPLYAAFGVFVFLEVTTKCYMNMNMNSLLKTKISIYEKYGQYSNIHNIEDLTTQNYKFVMMIYIV